MVKRYTRKLPKRGGATYRERQNAQLCGKHAINHVLQEEKFVWLDKNMEVYIVKPDTHAVEPKTARDKNIQINFYGACKNYERVVFRESFMESFDKNIEQLLDKFHARGTAGTPPPENVVITPEKAVEMAATTIRVAKAKSVGKRTPHEKLLMSKSPEELAAYYMEERKKEYTEFMAERERIQAKYKDKSDEQIREEFKAEQLQLANSPTEKQLEAVESCVYEPLSSRGNMEVDLLSRWANMLGLKGYKTFLGQGEDFYGKDGKNYIPEMIKVIKLQLDIPEFLGVLLGTGGHYTAIVMYDDVCEPARRIEKDKTKHTYAYINSIMVRSDKCLQKGTKECYTQKDLEGIIKYVAPTAMVFLYGYDEDKDGAKLNPYKSVAYERMKAATVALVPAASEDEDEEEENEEEAAQIAAATEASLLVAASTKEEKP